MAILFSIFVQKLRPYLAIFGLVLALPRTKMAKYDPVKQVINIFVEDLYSKWKSGLI